MGSYVINPDHTVTYSYEVNNTDDALSVFSWALEFAVAPDWNQSDVPLGDVSVPNDNWIAMPGIAVTPGLFAQDYLSLNDLADVPANGALAGFSFTSTYLPGPVTYYEFFSGGGPSASGEVIGPAFARASVPDGGGQSLGVIAFLSLAAFGARLKAAHPERAAA